MMNNHHHHYQPQQEENLHQLNEMSRGEQETPLLANEEEGGNGQNTFSQNERRIDIFTRNSIKQKSAIAVQIFAIIFVALVWGLVFSLMPLNPLPLFGYHPIIQSLSFLLLLQAILTLQPTSIQNPLEKQKSFSIHKILNLFLFLPLLTLGCSIMWYLHNQKGSKHFISWHGILGTILIIFIWLQIFFGLVLTSFNSIFGGRENSKKFYKFHRISGYSIILFFVFVLYLGATQTSWSNSNSSSIHKLFITVSLIGIIITLFLRIQWSKLPKIFSSS